ncbi:MAG: adenylate/guanylate cyclase domain-containing protein [Candidatus Limnocylindria bacterium]
MRPSSRPETQFAWHGDDALAYQVIGDGPTDLVYLQGLVSNVELNWDHPVMARFLTGLARNRRLTITDARGWGCSERSSPHEPWPIEVMMEDLGVVLDAVGSTRAVIMANNDCAFVATLFAATYPDRTAGLILYEASANWLWTEETPWEWTAERWQQEVADYRTWSRDDAATEVDLYAPSMAGDERYVEWWYRYYLLSGSPGYAAASAAKYMEADIRALLPAIRVPVAVLVRPGHPEPSWRHSATYFAAHVPGARLVEIPGRDQPLWLGDQDAVFRTIDRFVADIREERGELDRVVATVLFTDIVASTETATRLGDHAWREVVDRHHATVRAHHDRFRGTQVDTAGDGFFATFDGPARAIRCALAIIESLAPLGIDVRAGLHTGECEVIDGKVGGIAVNIGARVAGLAGPREVLVSQTVRDLVAGSGLSFEDRGEHALKGIPESWRLYRAGNPTQP